ncbi:MAG: hypothetical protein ACI910_001265 [Oleispira sp.]|jgi:hypothetical protein
MALDVPDNNKALVPIKIPFQFDPIEYNYLTVCTSGILKRLPIDGMHRDYINESSPTNQGDLFIAVYWCNPA